MDPVDVLRECGGAARHARLRQLVTRRRLAASWPRSLSAGSGRATRRPLRWGWISWSRRRDAELSSRGFVVLRFTWHDIVNRREWWLAKVRQCHAGLFEQD